jgi:hypothetical protein
MIGITVRELTYLKILQPIMDELHQANTPYVLYHFDAHRGDKEYNRASLANIGKSSESIIKNAAKVKAFKDDKQLQQMLVHDQITKLVSIEIWLWAKSYIKFLKDHNIKTYSLLYLTDSLWQSDPACVTSMDRVYYSTDYLMRAHHDFAGITHDARRDRCIGSPIFDGILNKPSDGKDILILLPNLRGEHANVAFGSAANFLTIMDKICANRENRYIFKTRTKQWLPEQIKKYATEIISDGDKMNPPIIQGLLKRSYCTVMFYSSGIYECVYGGNYVLNIPLNLKRWGWDKSKMKEYFSTEEHNVYQIKGVVESINQDNILKPDWTFQPKHIDSIARNYWVEKFIGSSSLNSSRIIVKDILSS